MHLHMTCMSVLDIDLGNFKKTRMQIFINLNFVKREKDVLLQFLAF